METRPYGGGFANFVGIKCGWCDHEAWHPCKNGGWAIRIFRAHGWKMGNKPSQHRCPTCFAKAKSGRRRVADNPVIPPEVGKMLKKQMAYEALPATADPAPPAEPPAPVLSDPGPPATVIMRKPVRGLPSIPGVTVFTRREHAARSGIGITGSVDGLAFYTVPLGDGWTWKRTADTTQEERAAWAASRRTGPRVLPRADGSHIVLKPTPKETPMTAKVVPMKEPMPTQDPLPAVEVHADPARKPTRDERNAIHDELTKVYDPVDERYAGSDSDKTVAERLDVPRAWVVEVREMFFGAHDRNKAALQKMAGLDKAIALAKQASARLLEMAAEADTLERELVAARNQLEG